MHDYKAVKRMAGPLNANAKSHTLYTSKSQSSLTQSAWPGAPDTRHTGRGARPRPTTQAAAGADEAVMEYRMYHSTPLNGIMTSESGKGVSKPHESCT